MIGKLDHDVPRVLSRRGWSQVTAHNVESFGGIVKCGLFSLAITWTG